jgi:phosphohistidine phosphatase
MKTLYIIRHAKAEDKSVNKTDYDRKLSATGERDARLMGLALQGLGVHPDMVLSSPAERALHTAEIVIDALDLSVDNIVCNKDIYNTTLKTLLKVLSQSPDKISSLMVFGHNPAFKDLVNYLGNKKFEKLPKGSVVTLKFEIEKWSKINKRSGQLTYFEYPKNLQKNIQLKG